MMREETNLEKIASNRVKFRVFFSRALAVVWHWCCGELLIHAS